MPQIFEDADAPLLGLASGLAAGVVGALAMTVFQDLLSRADITSGVKGVPSTEKAADRVSRFTTGRSLSRSIRPAAGEAIHYGIGGLVGGLYGLAAEVDSRVTAGRGAAFGVVAATVVDETLVPATGLGDPFWKAPVVSHPYSYASHTVFGTATEAARKFFRRFFGDVKAGVEVLKTGAEHPTLETTGKAGWRTLSLAFMLGATAGPRTSAPLATVSWAARLGLVDLKGSKLEWLGTSKAVSVTTPMAIGELIADKLPSTPSRTAPGGVLARTATGALSGAALVGGRAPAAASAALAGAAGALLATYLGHTIRTRVAKSIGRDWPIAGVEDLLAFGGAALVCLAALAPVKDTETSVES